MRTANTGLVLSDWLESNNSTLTVKHRWLCWPQPQPVDASFTSNMEWWGGLWLPHSGQIWSQGLFIIQNKLVDFSNHRWAVSSGPARDAVKRHVHLVDQGRQSLGVVVWLAYTGVSRVYSIVSNTGSTHQLYLKVYTLQEFIPMPFIRRLNGMVLIKWLSNMLH